MGQVAATKQLEVATFTLSLEFAYGEEVPANVALIFVVNRSVGFRKTSS